MTAPTQDKRPGEDGRRVLLLGAGLVTPPLINYLLDHELRLTVAGNTPDRAAEMVGDRGQVVDWTVGDRRGLARMVEGADLVISLLPATMHPPVAEACLEHRRSLVTASYVSSEMQALDERARAAGLIFLNELGADPGIDHMSAMRVIHDVQRRGGRLTAFRSYCGGLPAPEANDNPWGYKFSWSPIGVLRATTSSARYLEQGVEQRVASERLFVEVGPLEVSGMRFEAYANRDSLGYIETYGLAGVETMYRGTLRWPGWAATMRALRALGLMAEDPPRGASWPATLVAAAGLQAGASPRPQLAAHLGAARDDRGAALLSPTEVEEVVERLAGLGLLDDGQAPRGATVLESLAELMLERMSYAAGERDMIVMQHRFEAAFDGGAEGGERVERLSSTMVVLGDPQGHSAMARTVSLPVAIAARLVLDGTIAATGVQVPVVPEIYQPILDELSTMGITLEEETQR